VVVADIGGKDAAQMALIEDYDMVQALSADRADHAFNIGVLPR
jgi:predicted nucleic acid-binding protein